MVEIVGFDRMRVKEATCGGCAARLQYKRLEIQEKRVSHMGEVDTERYIVCPNCGHHVSVRLV